MRKGIILAGGKGTRLYPLTAGISKQLLPVYDKPMIFYSLSVLMLAGIKDILLISTSADIPSYKRLLGDGERFGINLSYQIQEYPHGIPQAFTISESFIGNDSVCMILGDNFFYGQSFQDKLRSISERKDEATVLIYNVANPEHYGVLEFNSSDEILSIEEKPVSPKSSFAITGLYFFDNSVIDYSKSLEKSLRGEFEITDLIKKYLVEKKLKFEILGRGFAWLDTGTHDRLIQASSFVQAIEHMQGQKIACIEEIALNNQWITKQKLKNFISSYGDCEYKEYLQKLANIKI